MSQILQQNQNLFDRVEFLFQCKPIKAEDYGTKSNGIMIKEIGTTGSVSMEDLKKLEVEFSNLFIDTHFNGIVVYEHIGGMD